MEWMQNPWVAWWISAFALIALGFAGCLYLFYTVKQESSQLQRRLREQRSKFDEERRRLISELESYRDSLSAAPPATSVSLAAMASSLGDTVSSGSGSIDSSKRGQALRMYRRGETIEDIATVLQVPPGEVDLLVKVQSAIAAEGTN
jgi:hypothetical protein